MKYEVRLGGRVFEVTVDGERVRVGSREVRATLLGVPHSPLRRLVLDGRSWTLGMTRHQGGWTVHGAGNVWSAEVVDERARALRQLVGQGSARPGGATVKAPMPGLVLRIEVEPGQRVVAGEGLLVLEAMKMENEIRAPVGGVIERIVVSNGQAVEKGAVLLEIDEAQG